MNIKAAVFRMLFWKCKLQLPSWSKLHLDGAFLIEEMDFIEKIVFLIVKMLGRMTMRPQFGLCGFLETVPVILQAHSQVIYGEAGAFPGVRAQMCLCIGEAPDASCLALDTEQADQPACSGAR